MADILIEAICNADMRAIALEDENHLYLQETNLTVGEALNRAALASLWGA